jgi:hypothetical protein
MPRNVNDISKHLSPALRKKVEARAGDRASVETGYLGLANRRLRDQLRRAESSGSRWNNSYSRGIHRSAVEDR